IVAELLGEKIDIIPWSEDPLEFIARSLSPAEVKYVESVEDEKKAKVVVADDKLSLAIGKEGQNARLAARLTGWKIDVKSQSSFEQENQEKLEGANEFYEEELAKLESEDAEKAANADNAVEQVENDIVDTDVENVDDALAGVDEVEMSNETEIKE
ncbi:MAG: hypothetical protein RR327_02310, partial [Clostridia bacterium]